MRNLPAVLVWMLVPILEAPYSEANLILFQQPDFPGASADTQQVHLALRSCAKCTNRALRQDRSSIEMPNFNQAKLQMVTVLCSGPAGLVPRLTGGCSTRIAWWRYQSLVTHSSDSDRYSDPETSVQLPVASRLGSGVF